MTVCPDEVTTVNALHCDDCGEDHPLDYEGVRRYECSRCNGTQAEDDGNRCEQCNIFMGRADGLFCECGSETELEEGPVSTCSCGARLDRPDDDHPHTAAEKRAAVKTKAQRRAESDARTERIKAELRAESDAREALVGLTARRLAALGFDVSCHYAGLNAPPPDRRTPEEARYAWLSEHSMTQSMSTEAFAHLVELAATARGVDVE